MRILFLITTLVSFFLCNAQENQASFEIRHNIITNKLSLWKYKKRRNTFKQIKSTSFYAFSSDVGSIIDDKLNYDWIDAVKNDYKILVKAYHKNRPDEIQTKLIKVRKPVKVEIINKDKIGITPGIFSRLHVKMHFDDNTSQYIRDLKTYFVSIVSEENQIVNNSILVPATTDLNKKDVTVKVVYDLDTKISQSIQIPINYNVNERFNYNGKRGGFGQHGQHGQNISVYVKRKTDSLVGVLIKSDSTQEHVIANLYTSSIHISTNGGNGGKGFDGTDGERGARATDSRPAADGYPGGNGSHGGNGGDGGFVDVYYDSSLEFVDVNKLITVSNEYGRGGVGGKGGSGGRGGYSDENKKALEILFNINGGNIGISGTDGNYGANGRNGLPPRFTKLKEEEIYKLYSNL